MALKNMIKLKDFVKFGRASETKRSGVVTKLNPKTAHIRMRNGDVMSVSYGFIQLPAKLQKLKRAAAKRKAPASKRKTAKRSPTGRRYTAPPKHNPANFTAKGERAYKHIKKGYGSDPRAKEIAARTVYNMAKTTPGLVKANKKPTKHRVPPKRKNPVGGAYETWTQKQNVTQLRQLEKAYKSIIASPSGMTLKNDARRKSTIIKKELRRRGK